VDLKERLVDLAEEVRDVQPPIGLWDQEVRRRARARRDTVVVALVAILAIAGLLVGDWHAARQSVPASPTVKSFLPDHFYVPSAWLPGTDRAGELGPLIGITVVDRGAWSGSAPGVVGVSATTGRYAFLDLPGLADPQQYQPAMTPDGRHVAYWVRGTPSGSPHPGGPTVTGVAVYDAVTGEVRRADLGTEHGIAPDKLTFIADDVLVASLGQYAIGTDGDSDTPGMYWLAEPVTWRLSDSSPTPSPGVEFDEQPAINGRWLWQPAMGGSVVLDTTGVLPPRRLPGPKTSGALQGYGPQAALSPDGRTLAVVLGVGATFDRAPNAVRVVSLDPSRARCCGVGRRVPGSGGQRRCSPGSTRTSWSSNGDLARGTGTGWSFGHWTCPRAPRAAWPASPTARRPTAGFGPPSSSTRPRPPV